MSATRMAYHLEEARTSIDTAAWHLRAAYQQDPDPEIATEVYLTALQNLNKICEGLKLSRQPDIDREAGETE